MNGDLSSATYAGYLLAWIVTPILLYLYHSRKGKLGGFLVSAYFLSFIINHWFGALVHFPVWTQLPDSGTTQLGFQYSTVGLLAFSIGTLAVRGVSMSERTAAVSSRHGELERLYKSSVQIFIPLGIIAWMASVTRIAEIPSMTAFLSAGKSFLVLGICTACWSAWHNRKKRQFYYLMALSFLLPVVTVATAGFIGYGIAMTTTVLAFVAMFFRPRVAILVGLLVLLFSGLSLWVAYSDHRNEIRSTVWGGEAYESRLNAIVNVASSVSPFDVADPLHQAAVDSRLNQNFLVGAAVQNTPSLVPFRYGQTVQDAFLALIPRIIWSGKPGFGGSGTYVSQHTQIQFAQGTSVGMGQVLEFYINFGLGGVFFGFLLMGIGLRYMDVRLSEAIQAGDWRGVVFLFVVGVGALQNGGALAEIAGSMAAGAVAATLAMRLVRLPPPARRYVSRSAGAVSLMGPTRGDQK